MYEALKDCTALLVINDMEDFVFTICGFHWFENSKEMKEYKRIRKSRGQTIKTVRLAFQVALLGSSVYFGYWIADTQISQSLGIGFGSSQKAPEDDTFKSVWDCIDQNCILPGKGFKGLEIKESDFPPEARGWCALPAYSYLNRTSVELKNAYSLFPFDTARNMCLVCMYNNVTYEQGINVFELTDSEGFRNTTEPSFIHCHHDEYDKDVQRNNKF
jgi:hypothetical protein